MAKYKTSPLIVWVDCEMTGLDVNCNQLLEIAAIITDSSLREVDSLGPLVIKADHSVLIKMDSWNTTHHKESGLYWACLSSQLTVSEADRQLYNLLIKHNLDQVVLAGNNVGHDKMFLEKYCPLFAKRLYFRSIDVSSFAEITRRWYPNTPFFKKNPRHRALDDIRESITEMKYYKDKFFK